MTAHSLFPQRPPGRKEALPVIYLITKLFRKLRRKPAEPPA